MSHYSPKTLTEKILLGVLLFAVLWGVLTAENRALYAPEATSFPNGSNTALDSFPALKQRLQEVTFQAEDGTTLSGWYVTADKKMPTVVLAHGNGGNIGDRAWMIQRFVEQGYGFFAFDYRGYGNSQGTPSESGLYADMEAASRYLSLHKQIPTQDQIVLGESLGGAVVTNEATQRQFRAVVLFCTPTSMPEKAHAQLEKMGLGWLSPLTDGLLRQHFDTLTKIDQLHSPLLIIHGSDDEFVPVLMARQLYAQATTPHKKLLIIEGAGHNNVFSKGEARLFSALEQLLAESAKQYQARPLPSSASQSAQEQ